MTDRIWTVHELLKEKPKGELKLLDAESKLFDAFMCHGCQTCWRMNIDTDEIREDYPHILRLELAT